MSGIIKESEVEVVAKTIIYTMQGALALYFSDNGLTNETEGITLITQYNPHGVFIALE